MTDILNGQSSWEKIKSSGKPAVIYGTGNGADMVLDEFIRLGIPVKGVAASDGFVRDRVFRGFKVRPLSAFDGDFITAIAFGSHRPEVVSHILSLAKEREVIVPVVPVCGGEIFNRAFVQEHLGRIEKAYELFSGRSKDVYRGCAEFMFSGSLDTLFSVTCPEERAFEDVLKLTDGESYLDLGAYRGDTVERFLGYTGGSYREIIAAEPDKKNFAKLASFCGGLENCTAVNAAAASYTGRISFESKGGRQSSAGANGTETPCFAVDDLCADKDLTYIKADIEGQESEMLHGAAETIRRCRPKLNIALYHKSRDIFEIPLLVNEINPAYRFEIMRHPCIPCWDMNLYCV